MYGCTYVLENDPTFQTSMDLVQKILISLLAGLFVILAIFYYQGKAGSPSKSSKFYKPTVLLLGANSAGKTSLFFKLLGKERASTISSLEPNVDFIGLPFSNKSILKQYQFIDYPGHLKYSQLLRKLIVEDVTVKMLKGIVYVVDSSSQNLGQLSQVAAMAKSLFELLSITEKTPNGVDFLFAINKQDLFDSRPVFKVKQLLEEELTKLITNELSLKGQARGSGIDNDEEENDQVTETAREFWSAVVGPSRQFRFELLEGNMEFIGGSVTKNNVQNWENWFDEKAVNYGGM